MQAKLGFLPFIWTSHMFFLRITPRTSQYNPQILSSNHMQTHIWAQSANFSKINLHIPLHLIILLKNSINTKFFQPALISSPPLTKTAKTQQTHKSFLHKWNNSWSTNTKISAQTEKKISERKKKNPVFLLFSLPFFPCLRTPKWPPWKTSKGRNWVFEQTNSSRSLHAQPTKLLTSWKKFLRKASNLSFGVGGLFLFLMLAFQHRSFLKWDCSNKRGGERGGDYIWRLLLVRECVSKKKKWREIDRDGEGKLFL